MSLKINSGFFLFRHHTYKKVDGQVELSEVGPRFEMKGMLKGCHSAVCGVWIKNNLKSWKW